MAKHGVATTGARKASAVVPGALLSLGDSSAPIQLESCHRRALIKLVAHFWTYWPGPSPNGRPA